MQLKYVYDVEKVLLRELSREEEKYFAEKQKYIEGLISFEQLFSILQNSVLDFWKYYFEIVEKMRLKIHFTNKDFFEEVSLLNLKLSSILASKRAYYDHLTKALRKLSPSTDELFKYSKELSSRAYDNCFGYKFICELRNHTQHFSMPIVSYKKGVNNVENKHEYYVDIFLSKTSLQQDKKFTNKICLDSFDERINIRSIIHEFYGALTENHFLMRKFLFQEFKIFEQRLLSIKDECLQHMKENFSYLDFDLDLIIMAGNSSLGYYSCEKLPIIDVNNLTHKFSYLSFSKDNFESYSTNKN